jgi:3,4-dihydroxy 2-butanone 4-phosphate synthase/GTP cyclohydrolase II
MPGDQTHEAKGVTRSADTSDDAMYERLPRRNTVSGQLLYLGARPLPTRHGEFLAHVAQNLATGAVAFAISRGDFRSGEPLLARVHSSCVTSETFGGCDCDCVEQLDAALAQIADVGRGVVFYLLQEGRGAGLVAKARDRMIVQASGHRVTTFEAYTRMGLEHDLRRYEDVGSLCRLLEVEAPLTILTNNADKLSALEAQSGVAIAGSEVLTRPASPWNQHYIRSKYRSGHQLEDPSDQKRATLPEPVVAFEPHPLPEDPRFLVMASYFLPIRPVDREHGVDPVWFRVHAYFDLASGAERVVLSYGDADAANPLVRIQRESLLERFPLANGGASKSLWHASVREMVSAGAGIATFVSPDGFDAELREMPGDPGPCARLLSHHLRDRAMRPLVFDGEPDAAVLDTLVHVATIGEPSPAKPNGSNGHATARERLA